MNKLTYTALGLSVVALLFAGAVMFTPKTVAPSLGGDNPPSQSYQGFIHSISTSSVIASTDFRSSANTQYLNSVATVTSTLPAATSTFATCAAIGTNLGSSISGLIVNDSTNTVDYAVGTGDIIKCETNGVGTSTVTGGCSASAFSVLASTTVQYAVFFDSSSSTFIMTVGNNFK